MENIGVSFGWNFPGLVWIEFLVWVIVFYIYIKNHNLGWLLIVIGGALNLIERILYGGVCDYWKIPLVPIYNNLNDYLIFGGVVKLLWKKKIK